MKKGKLLWITILTLVMAIAFAATAYAEDGEKADLNSDACQVTYDLVNDFADGNAVEPAVTVTCNDEVVAPENYDVTYENNTAVTTEAKVTVTAKEESELITGTYSGTFRISYPMSKYATAALTWSSKKVKFKPNADCKVITVVQKPTVKSVTGMGGAALTKDTDYTVKYSNASSKNAGTYKVTITATAGSNYSGSIVKTYKITPISINNEDFFSYASRDYFYTGKKVKPTIIKIGYYKSGIDLNLVKKTHYTVTKAATFSNNVKIGWGNIKITIKGKGNFTGTKVVTGGFVIGPTKATVKTIKAGKKQLTITWKKSPKADGYIIEYGGYKGNSSTAWKMVTVKSRNTLSKTIKNLKSGYTYDVFVYSYKKVDGQKVYAFCNNFKTVKVK